MGKIAKYSRVKKLGSGGNGEVYAVKLGQDIMAMKTLKDFSKTNKYARFRDEVNALSEMGPMANVVRILDFNLPESPQRQDVPFYVMPVGVPLVNYLEGKSHKLIFQLFLKIAKAVAELHKKGYTHRDIKPENLLFIDQEPVLSDFGLVSFPDKTYKSVYNEKIGPQWTIAPEMQRTSSTAEFMKADVYSLAKTLWILITGRKLSFEGQYIRNSNISINCYVDVMVNKMTDAGGWYYHSTVILDKLLSTSTDNDPSRRPSAEEFYETLKFWFESNEDFMIRNPYEWEEALEVIFPHGIPDTCKWNSPRQIFSVLSVLTNYDNLNHFFYPDRGGGDMKSVELIHNDTYLAINNNTLISPKVLIFRSHGVANLSYFRLVVNESEAFGQDEDGREDYIADGDFNYITSSGERKIDGVLVTRYLKGSFIFINKCSKINNIKGRYREDLYVDGYTAIHNKISEDEYHEMLGNYK